jgi:glucose-6-phosphate 1-epimerase
MDSYQSIFMMTLASTIQTLYQTYGHLKGITIECQNELVAIGIKNKAAVAEVFLQGAQLTRYQRASESPVLFLSEGCRYKAGVSLRGGIPICWPWFGDLKKNPASVQQLLSEEIIANAPAHGFVRDRQWTMESISTPSDFLTILELSYSTTKAEPLWPYETALSCRIEIGDRVALQFSVKNCGDQPLVFSSALHSYFALEHIDDVTIQGFDQTPYIDALDEWKLKQQDGPIHFTEEVDRIYQTGCASVNIVDGRRQVKILSTGSNSTVVWNPWIEKSQRLSQFMSKDYQSMVCIETANAVNDVITLLPDQTHVLAFTAMPLTLSARTDA